MRETGRVLVTAPTESPVSRALAKSHLRETPSDTSQDDLIDQMIAAAVDEAEQYQWRKFCRQTWDIYYDCFPSGGGCFSVPLPPLISVTSISYTDADGVTQTIDASDYQVDITHEPAIIRAAYNETWPVVRDQTLQAVKVRAVIGYATPDAIPKSTIQGILVILGRLYEHREDVVVGTIAAELPLAAQHLLDRHAVREMVA